MILRRLSTAILLMAFLLAGAHAARAQGGKEREAFNQAKILMFDKEWEEARAAFRRIIREYPSSSVVPQCYFFSARCLQLQAMQVEALLEYEEFLRRYPNEPFLPKEARNAVVEIAASLYQKGDTSYRDRLATALNDTQKEVRYFTALRCSHINDRHLNALIVPILKEITRQETERELVDRARIALLRIDPKALSEPSQPAGTEKEKEKERRKEVRSGDGKLFHLEVYEGGNPQPRVELKIPVALAQLAIAALDESAKQEMRKKGIDVDNVWESLSRMGPTDILTIRDGKNLVKIWIR